MCLLLAACAQADADRIADEIEETIVLPAGSNSLQSYSRYYFQDADGTVYGSYMTYSENFREFVRQGCIKRVDDGYPCDRKDVGVIDAETRIWIPERRHIPFANGGGCLFIYFEYDIDRSKMKKIECNGPY